MNGSEKLENNMRKTLLICDVHPLPENTGANIRTMNFVRFFKQYGSVDIVFTYPSPDGTKDDAMFENIYPLERQAYPRHFIGRLRAFAEGQPYPVHLYTDHGRELLNSAIKNNDYDYILVRYIVNTYCLFGLPTREKRKIILDFDDVVSGSLYETFFDDRKSLYKKMIRAMNRNLLLRYEKKCLDLNVSLFCSENDKKRMCGNKENSFVVPNVYANETFENYEFGDGYDNNNNQLLFLGTLHYSPNIEGLKWFIESIYPMFKREHPDGKLLVVGHSPGDEVTKMCKATEGVELYANVGDVREYYRRCKAVVVPLLSGGGTRIKILEAALAGRPVISTPLGAEGLDLVDERHVLLFHNAQEFSLRFKEILDREKYYSLINTARDFVLHNYSMKKFNESMEKVLHTIDGKHES
jgi:glycosyltransferase involved in cell wall biosynthesis